MSVFPYPSALARSRRISARVAAEVEAEREHVIHNARLEAFSEVGRELMRLSSSASGPKGAREAALWDAACYVVEKMGDGDWRRQDRPGSSLRLPDGA